MEFRPDRMHLKTWNLFCPLQRCTYLCEHKALIPQVQESLAGREWLRRKGGAYCIRNQVGRNDLHKIPGRLYPCHRHHFVGLVAKHECRVC